MKFAVLLSISAALSLAAESTVSGPSLGYVLDNEANAVRRIAGVAGSSTMDAPLALQGFRALAVASIAGYAVGAAEDGTVSFVRLRTLDHFTVDGVGGSPDSAVTSASGSALLLFWKDGNRIQVLNGLPDAPSVSFEGTLPGAPAISAVNDTGSQALIVIHAGDGDTLYTAASGNLTALQKTDRITAADFARRGSDAFFTDASALYRVHAGNIDRIADAASVLALAADSGTVLLARQKSITAVSLTDFSATDVPCGCPVSTVRALTATVFRVSDAMNAPLWILDVSGSDPAFYFIPQAGGGNE